MSDEVKRTIRVEAPEGREQRTEETREAGQRQATWSPPSLLPDPEPCDGWSFRWIRTSMAGTNDNINVSRAFREGYVPGKAEDHPELKIISDYGSRFDGNVEVGGLLLCKIPTEMIEQKKAYLKELADNASEAVDQNFMRENNPRMPLLKPERSSRTTFGKGND